ncbi:MAG TPA: hypothetical protein VEK34_11890 [Methylocella sp.]|nr:hypothetical protein [Methylocella sp.]
MIMGIFAGILSGIVLGRNFAWPVLIPAIAIALLWSSVFSEPGLMGGLISLCALSASLQFGYFLGVFTRRLHSSERPNAVLERNAQ